MFKQFNTAIFVAILDGLARLPFTSLPFFGWILGWVNYLLSPKTAKTMQENLRASRLFNDELTFKKILHANIHANGMGVLETLHIWRKPYAKTLKLVKQCSGWVAVEGALKQQKGIIFLTPHLGCYEITSLYYAQFAPITVMFRSPRQSWLLPFILQGRQRGQVTLAPANSHGIKLLLSALKRGEAIGILPDQAPLAGEGEWAPFFGKDADTMTLASKLANKTGAAVFMAFGERLGNAQGYHVHIKALADGAIATPALLNTAIEAQNAQCPSQYLWRYNRYKVRR